MERDLVRIVFELEPDAWHGNATERLWADRVGPDRYRLRNTPFFAFGVSHGDVVLGEERDGQVFFKATTIRSGHSSYRIRLRNEDDRSAFLRYWEPIARMGCTYEGGPVMAIDVPAPTDIHSIYRLLEAGEAAGVWDFEEGHCGHLVE